MEKKIELSKEDERELIKLIKLSARKKSYKGTSSILYKKEKDFFVHSLYFVSKIEKMLMIIAFNFIKTYKSDNLFWHLLMMESNISQKDSLRANGAFTMPSFQINECSVEILDIQEASQEIVKNISKTHDDFIEKVRTVGGFNKYLLEQEKFANEKLIKILAYIELEDYSKANEMVVKEIEKGNRGGYINYDKDIYQYIQEYCKSLLEQGWNC